MLLNRLQINSNANELICVLIANHKLIVMLITDVIDSSFANDGVFWVYDCGLYVG